MDFKFSDEHIFSELEYFERHCHFFARWIISPKEDDLKDHWEKSAHLLLCAVIEKLAYQNRLRKPKQYQDCLMLPDTINLHSSIGSFNDVSSLLHHLLYTIDDPTEAFKWEEHSKGFARTVYVKPSIYRTAHMLMQANPKELSTIFLIMTTAVGIADEAMNYLGHSSLLRAIDGDVMIRVPKELLKHLALHPGDRLTVETREQSIIFSVPGHYLSPQAKPFR